MDFPLKNISYILLGIILVLPQLDTFGIDIGITTIYYEEIVYALLIFVFLLYVIKNKKVVVDQSVILALFILILSILPGLYIGISKNGILRALQDFRPMLYYTSIIPFVFLLKDIDKKRFFNIILVLIWIHFIILFSVYLLREKHFLADVYALSINRGERFVGEKNEIILALIFSYYLSFLLYRYHNKINIVKFLLILIPVSATIYMTQTRAVFIALVVSIIISILMLFRFKLIRFSYIMRLLFLILPFILIYLIRAHFIEIDYNKNIISRFTTSKSLLQDSSVIARFYSSYEAYNLIRTSPILGVGYGQEIIIVPEWLAGYESRSYYIDNSLITIAVKSGLLGFLGLLFFFSYFIIRAYRYLVNNIKELNYLDIIYEIFLITTLITILVFSLADRILINTRNIFLIMAFIGISTSLNKRSILNFTNEKMNEN